MLRNKQRSSTAFARADPTRLRRPLTDRLGLLWREQRQALALLPLRAFLGATFIFAGLQKLADRWFFDASAPSSVQAQLHAYAGHSALPGIAAAAAHNAVLAGLAIAFGELAVGIGCLLGLWTRAAAAGGVALSLSFLLIVSWHAKPYYTGADIVFVFAWVPLLLAGGGPLSLDSILRHRTARSTLRAAGLASSGAAMASLCGGDCATCVDASGDPRDLRPAPVRNARREDRSTAPPILDARLRVEVDRRTFLAQARLAGALAAAALLSGAVAAAAGRLVSPARAAASSLDTAGAASAGAASSNPSPPTSATSTPSTSATTGHGQGAAHPPTTPQGQPVGRPTTVRPAPTAPAGTVIGPSSAVPVGGSARFTDPGSGDPAVVFQPTAGSFAAFSAVCTHQGCTVSAASGSHQLVCPCHGAVFDASSGAALRGPTRQGLPRITVTLGGDGNLYAS